MEYFDIKKKEYFEILNYVVNLISWQKLDRIDWLFVLFVLNISCIHYRH